jgi:Na+/H+ antiporter NhaC
MFAQRGRLSQDDWDDLNNQSSGDSGGGFFVFIIIVAIIVGAIYLYARFSSTSSSEKQTKKKSAEVDWRTQIELDRLILERQKKKDKQENIGCIIALIIMVLWLIIYFASNPQYL